MRGWAGAIANQSEPRAISAVMRSLATGRVLAQGDAGYAVGNPVMGRHVSGWLAKRLGAETSGGGWTGPKVLTTRPHQAPILVGWRLSFDVVGRRAAKG